MIYQAIETAILETIALKHTPTRLEFMCDAYGQFLTDLGLPRRPIYVGQKVDPLFGIPVEIVPGALKEWRLITD